MTPIRWELGLRMASRRSRVFQICGFFDLFSARDYGAWIMERSLSVWICLFRSLGCGVVGVLSSVLVSRQGIFVFCSQAEPQCYCFARACVGWIILAVSGDISRRCV